MVQDKTVERLEQSAVRLKVTVEQPAVSAAYDDLLAGYQKSAQIPGFRKGKAPRAVLERKFGEAFRVEAAQKVIDDALKEAFESIEEKPLPYAQPLLEDESLELDPQQPFTFSVRYDVYPEFEVAEYRGLSVENPSVTVSDEDIDRELEEMRQRNAMVVDRESGVVEAGDVVTISMVEVDANDEEVPGTAQEDLSFTIGHGHNLYHIDQELIGFGVDETRILEKSFDDDFGHEEVAGTTRRIRVSMKSVKMRDIPDIDDEFAQDVSDDFETLADLKADVRTRLEGNAEQHVRRRRIRALMEQIAAATEIAIPATMVDSELRSSWSQLAQQYRMPEEQLQQILAQQGRSMDDLFEEWRPAATERVKRSLITQKLIEAEKIEVTDEEAEAQIREDAEKRGAGADQIVEYYRSAGMFGYLKNEIAETRLFDTLLAASKKAKGPKLSYMDVISENE